MPEAPPVVTLEGVTVAYGQNRALVDVTASFAAGAVGLLGPNGAGKSTMIKTLLGFLVPERGRMRVLGYDVAESPLDIRARVGYMPESDAHIPGMNAVSFVAYCGELAGLPRAACVAHAGSYATLYQAYNSLLGWMEGNGCRMAGPIREVYLRYGADGLGFDLPPTYVAADQKEYVTELQLPIEKS